MKIDGRWQDSHCMQCGEVFFVRTCYVKRGQGKFCSISCATTYRNLEKNPAKNPTIRAKISANHADVSGKNNPMHGRTGVTCPGWIDGRNSIPAGASYRRLALLYKSPLCEICGHAATGRSLHVHHTDGNRTNNSLANLKIVCALCHNNILHPRIRDDFGRFKRGK